MKDKCVKVYNFLISQKQDYNHMKLSTHPLHEIYHTAPQYFNLGSVYSSAYANGATNYHQHSPDFNRPPEISIKQSRYYISS